MCYVLASILSSQPVRILDGKTKEFLINRFLSKPAIFCISEGNCVNIMFKTCVNRALNYPVANSTGICCQYNVKESSDLLVFADEFLCYIQPFSTFTLFVTRTVWCNTIYAGTRVATVNRLMTETVDAQDISMTLIY